MTTNSGGVDDGHGHGHSHGHGSLRLTPGSPRARRVLAAVVAVVFLATVAGLFVLRPTGSVPRAPGVVPGTTFVTGSVIRVEPNVCPSEYDRLVECLDANVRVTSGPHRGEIVVLPVTRGIPGSVDLERGDDIRMSYFPKGPAGYRYRFDEFQRQTPMVVLAVIFVVVVVALGRLQGFRSLVGMVLSLGVVIAYLLPALLRGGSPLLLALVVAVTVAFLVLCLAHGIHQGTHVAFVGSVLALAITAGLGAAFIHLCHFTGFADENVASLTVAAGRLDIRGLILAGLVVGALGILDDMTVTQVSAVSELQAADPTRSARDLYRAGLRIGRDHVASTVNTLPLAYAGAALPLLLLFSQGGRSFADVVTSETVAVEVVGALVGSIGLVAAVPITTGLAAWVVHRPAADAAASESNGGVVGETPTVTATATDPDDPWRHAPDEDFWDRK
jgi:uncharacterized membrane protein